MTDIKGDKKREKLTGIQRNVNSVESRYNELAEQLGGVRDMVRKKSELYSCSEISGSVSQSSSRTSFMFYSQNEVIQPERIVIQDSKPNYKSAVEKNLTLDRTIKSDLSTVPQKETSQSTRKVTYTNDTSSINNIISGITDSVNRLTNLQVHLAPVSSAVFESAGVKDVKFSLKKTKLNTEAEKPYQENPDKVGPGVSAATVQSKVSKKPKKKNKPLEKSEANQKETDATKAKNVTKDAEKKVFKPASTPNNSMLANGKNKSKTFAKVKAVSSKNILIKKFNKAKKEVNKWSKNKIVELYHNSQMEFEAMSKDNIEIQKVEAAPAEEVSNYLPRIEENKQLESCQFTRSYALPTIASKMKQVAKNYENFNFRTIPFVAARSITQSHNLGVNIQQMLSIIKGRKPISGISPTLAHNIALATNEESSQTLLALISNIQNNRTCPLDNRYNNYDVLEDIQEEPEEEDEAYLANKEGTPALTGAGDKEAVARGRMWSADVNKNRPNCECLPKNGTDFDEICAKYIPSKKPITGQRLSNNQWKRPRSKFGASPNSLNYMKNTTSQNTTEQKKHRSLKDVLKNLYEDFARLNNLHDELNYKITNQTIENPESLLEELQALEQELQTKEDEITTVMDLHKEVVVLKQQVRSLKKRASQPSVIASPIYRPRQYREKNPAAHLAKLLRYVQKFQNSVNSRSIL